MNLNFSELGRNVDKINAQLFENGMSTNPKIQKIFSSGKLVLLQLRLRGKNLCITLGRGGEHCGIWDSIASIPSEYRITRDQFLEFLRSNIRNARLSEIEVDTKDKCLNLKFSDKSNLLLFWKGRQLFFSYIYLNEGRRLHFSPWQSNKKQIFEFENFFDIFNELGRKQLDNKDINEKKLVLEEIEVFNKKAETTYNKKLMRKKKFIEKDLENCQVRHEIEKKLINDELDLSEHIFKYKSLKARFDYGLSYYQKKNVIFTKIKKLRKGEEFLEKRLEDVIKEIESKKVVFVKEKINVPVWKKVAQKSTEVNKSDDHSIFRWNNISIAVGLNTKGNDYIRSKWSTKGDIWFHLDGDKSAHVIAKNLDVFDFDKYSVVASILADYSEFNADQIPVIFTQVENLKGVKGAAGKVIYKKEKHLILPKVNWKEIISTSW
ncbi:PF05670 domain protein [Bacteriovorax sp. BAL6_X]|uniref:NFACT RNA binding domain-containing protein n=1 Tax=Bacteriovorax sp. BAL6_X TaxID=1201290 RepID=UPI000386A89B|nr:NFACT RNA binding domain-containing protein [Bacteriovorax sp. BAL6_X]EPZ50515.1 PF05670 domain protein [Bacteriovorax sp. BAL6_X]